MSDAEGRGPPFSAIVVTHDSAPDLRRLLASIERHLTPLPQLIVVDNASSDSSADLARRYGAEVIVLDHNAGFGAANNIGLARATCETTVLLNPDVELLDDGLLALVAAARRQDALHVPGLENLDASPQDSAHPRPASRAALAHALLPSRLLPARLRLRAEPWRATEPRAVGWAIAACLVARTSTLRRLGPFDPDVFLFYEDLELCLAARAAGLPTLLHPRIRLRHAGAHATQRAFGKEPHALLARRRREVVGRVLGPRALAIDDLAQGLTFITRVAGRWLLGSDASLPQARLRALRSARHQARRPDSTQNRPS